MNGLLNGCWRSNCLRFLFVFILTAFIAIGCGGDDDPAPVNNTPAGITQSTGNASGAYTYDSETDTLTIDINSSNFQSDCGPQVEISEFTVIELTATTMRLKDSSDDDGMTWTRASGSADSVIGEWNFSEGSITDATITFNADMTCSVSGTFECDDTTVDLSGYWLIDFGESDTSYWNISQSGKNLTATVICDDREEASGTINGSTVSLFFSTLDIFGYDSGTYGNEFEFGFEYLDPKIIKTYVIGTDFEAIDFQNSDTPYNLHAYSGSINVTSVNPYLEGTFTLTDFRPDHLDPTKLSGSVSGNFSISMDGVSSSIFEAQGTVAGYNIDITGSNITFSNGTSFSGTLSGNTIQGSYSGDDTGTWTATKLSSAPTCQ